jgi:hypothetical protein
VPDIQESANVFDALIAFRCPEALAERAKRAAARELTTASAYARRALLRELERDGIDPAKIASAA